MKYNTATDTRTRWYAGDDVDIGECVFAPDPSRPAEEWIVTSLHDSGPAGEWTPRPTSVSMATELPELPSGR